ncbi:MAG: OmpA family protein [Saprospiraceae bacterium]
MKHLNLLLALLVLAVAGQSCVSNKKFNALMAEKDALAQSLADNQNKLKAMEAEKMQLSQERDDLNSKMTMAQKDLDAMKSQLDAAKKSGEASGTELSKVKDALKNALSYYEKSGLTVQTRDDRMYLTNAQPILFRSGSVRLSREGKDFIATLAETLKANPELIMLVEGHTDNRSISSARYADNWDLSVIRATSVVRELVKNGVDPKQLTAAGRGEHAPADAADPATSDSRSANRRTEFVVLPRLSALSGLMK